MSGLVILEDVRKFVDYFIDVNGMDYFIVFVNFEIVKKVFGVYMNIMWI